MHLNFTVSLSIWSSRTPCLLYWLCITFLAFDIPNKIPGLALLPAPNGIAAVSHVSSQSYMQWQIRLNFHFKIRENVRLWLEAGDDEDKWKRSKISSFSTRSMAAAIYVKSERRQDNQKMKTLQKMVPNSKETLDCGWKQVMTRTSGKDLNVLILNKKDHGCCNTRQF